KIRSIHGRALFCPDDTQSGWSLLYVSHRGPCNTEPGAGEEIAMRKPTPEQGIALGALGLFVLLCAGVLVWSFQARSDALQELTEHQDQLAHLQAGARAKGDPRGQAKIATAPPAAFVDAPTAGVAGASLEAHVARLAGHRATLVSFSIQPS